MGSYPARVCADSPRLIAERSEINNCNSVNTMYVIPQTLEGTVKGSAPLNKFVYPGVTVSWVGTARFRTTTPRQFDQSGVFYYELSGAQLEYSVRGTNTLNNCSWSGSRTYLVGEGEVGDRLWTQFVRTASAYSGSVLADADFHFLATVDCGQTSFTEDINPRLNGLDYWIHTGATPRHFPDPGLTKLELRYNYARDAGPITYDWDLTAT
jgi:hypothetical protein